MEVKTDNSNLTQTVSGMGNESNVTRLENDDDIINIIKNESLDSSVKRRKLSKKEFHSESIVQNNKSLQKNRRDFIEENKDLDDIVYYFERGKIVLIHMLFILKIYLLNFF